MWGSLSSECDKPIARGTLTYSSNNGFLERQQDPLGQRSDEVSFVQPVEEAALSHSTTAKKAHNLRHDI